MTYALLQTNTDQPPPASLERAFTALDELVDIDAHSMSRDGYGILVANLAHRQAVVLQKALEKEGIRVTVVDENDILQIPPPVHTRRIDCAPGGLLVYNALGRASKVAWADVAVVAAGFVTLCEFDRKENTRVVVHGGGGHLPSCPIVLTDVATREHRRARLLLNLILRVRPGRFELEAHECQYNYLGSRIQQRYMDNFALMVQDLAALAKSAVLNRGSTSMTDDSTVTYHYPSRHAFEEELVWLLWNNLNARSPGTG